MEMKELNDLVELAREAEVEDTQKVKKYLEDE